MNFRRLSVLSLAVLVASAAQSASAAFISYTNQATWLGAVGPLSGTEDFNSFGVDTSFKGVSVALNNMSVIGTTGANGAVTQKIDALALEFTGAYSIDGTAQLLADITDAEFARFDFINPVTAWGAETLGAANVPRNTRIHAYDALNNLLGTVLMSSSSNGNELQFYGFQITGGSSAAYIIFTDNTSGANDVFGLDNIGFVTANNEIPEPSSLVLLGIGACVAGVGARRRRQAA